MNPAFAALADPGRRHILELLSAGEQPAGAVVELLRDRMSQPAVSQHLRVLRDADLVTVRAEGTRRVYGLHAEGIEAARNWLGGLLDPTAPFAQPLDALATELARGKRSRSQRAAS
jgi:DNA-binding transcriptional ArsR family regulator